MGNLNKRIILTEGWEGVIYREWGFSPEVIETWNALALGYGDARIFISHGWFENWWKAFGDTTGELLLIILRKNGVIKAIFPCCLKTASTDGRCKHYISSLTNDHTYYYDFVIDPEYRESAVSHFLCLLRQQYPRLQVFCDNFSAGSGNMILLAAELKHNWTPVYKCKQPWAPWIDVSGDWLEFNVKLNSNLRKTLKRRRGKANKIGNLQLRTVRKDANLDDTLNVIFGLEYDSWKGRGGTAIKCDHRVEYFYRLMSHWAMQSGSLWLFILELDNKPISFELCLASGCTLFGIKTGYDQSFSDLSPGNLVFDEIFKTIFPIPDIKCFNFLGPCDPYKKAWTQNNDEYGILRVYPKSIKGWLDYTLEHGWKEYLKRFSLVQSLRSLRNKKDVKSPN